MRANPERPFLALARFAHLGHLRGHVYCVQEANPQVALLDLPDPRGASSHPLANLRQGEAVYDPGQPDEDAVSSRQFVRVIPVSTRAQAALLPERLQGDGSRIVSYFYVTLSSLLYIK